MNELVFCGENGVPMTNSLLVAEVFGKQHKNVLRDIDGLECSDNFTALNFEPCMKIKELANGVQKEYRYYNITKDGFTFLAMGYTGKKAAEFKEKYIAAFNAMERSLREGSLLTRQFMETQMQMMNQMMTLCSSMMQRLDRMEAAMKEQPKESVAILMDSSGQELSVLQRSNLYGTKRMRELFPRYITVPELVERFTRIGVRTSKVPLFRYLRQHGYLSSHPDTYNCPMDHCIEKGWMMVAYSGTHHDRPKARRMFTPYLSPKFVEMLMELIIKELKSKEIKI